MTLRVDLLGAPRIVLGQGAPHVLERRDAALFALLALEGATLRSRVALLLWPDLAQKVARTHLRQRLFRLLRLTEQPLILAGDTLQLASSVAIDLHVARDALAVDPTACRGELLGSHDYSDIDTLAEWVEAARERWRQRRLDALAAEASQRESARRVAEALQYAQRIVAEEPLSEHGHRRLMRLHYLRGDRAAALEAARQCQDVLQRRLGLAPDPETQQLLALIQSADASPRRAPLPHAVAILRPPRLIGREIEWARLERLCGRRQTGLVIGEPGIGKTRLLADFAGSRNACLVSILAGDDKLPYAVLARILRALIVRHGQPESAWVTQELARVVPELGVASSSALQPLRLANAASTALQAWRAAGLSLLVIDDLHYADSASLHLLPALVAGGPSPKLTWLIGMRSNEVPAAAAWLDGADTRAPVRIALAPLDEADIEALLVSMSIADFEPVAWAAQVAQHTGGNPLYVIETMIAWVSERKSQSIGAPPALPVPSTISDLIRRRLEQLEPRAMRIAQVAAIAGQDVSPALVATVLDEDDLEAAKAWQELEVAHVIAEHRFAHDLIHSSVLRSIPATLAGALHGAVAAALAIQGTAPPARIADHWFAAGHWAKAAEAYLRAARQAHDASRGDDARPLFQRAADCHARDANPSAQRQALQEVITCLLRQHDIAGAKAVAAQLPDLAGDDRDAKAWAFDRLGEIANIARDDHATAAAARAMLAASPGSSNGWIQFNGNRKLAVALAYLGRFDESLGLFDSQSDWLRAHPHEWNVHIWHLSHGVSLELADWRLEALEVFDRTASVARSGENWYGVYGAMREHALCRYWLGDLQTALADMAEALRAGDRLGESNTTENPRDASRLAVLLRDGGRHDESLEWLQRSVEQLKAGTSQFWLAYCENELAVAYLELGQIARARALVAAETGCDNTEARAMRLLTRARCLRALRESPAADALPRAIFHNLECPRRWRLLAALETSRALTPAEALRVCDEVKAEASRHQLGGVALHAMMLAAPCAQKAGDTAGAETRLRQALSMADSEKRVPTGMSCVAWWWEGVRLFDELGLKLEADALAVKAARHLLDNERPHVPEEFMSSFLNRNPVHRDLLARFSRVLPSARE